MDNKHWDMVERAKLIAERLSVRARAALRYEDPKSPNHVCASRWTLADARYLARRELVELETWPVNMLGETQGETAWIAPRTDLGNQVRNVLLHGMDEVSLVEPRRGKSITAVDAHGTELARAYWVVDENASYPGVGWWAVSADGRVLVKRAFEVLTVRALLRSIATDRKA